MYNTLLLSALFLQQWLGVSHAVPPPAKPHVYRGDSRSPAEIKAQGGFLSRGYSVKVQTGFSLFQHALGDSSSLGTRKDSLYVPTSGDFEVAALFLDSSAGYVYDIQPTPNFVDVDKSLGEFCPYPGEEEFAAFGDIRWDQIRGWSSLPEGYASTSPEYTNNADYSPLYDRFGPGDAQPQLAGFPEGHAARNQEPWKSLTKPLETYAMEFMKKAQADVGWESLLGPWTTNALREVAESAKEADAAKSATEVSSKPRSAMAAAERARNAANKAMDQTRKIGEAFQLESLHDKLFDRNVFDKAWSLALQARKAAAVAGLTADTKSIESYQHEADESAEFITRWPLGMRDYRPALKHARNANDMAESLATKVTGELDSKIQTAELISGVNEVGENSKQNLDDLVIWLKSVESQNEALERELEALQMEIDMIVDKAGRIENHLGKIREIADLRARQQAEWTGNGKEHDFGEVALTVGAGLLSAIPGGGVLANLKWAQKAWMMFKAGKVANKVLQAGSLGEATTQSLGKISRLGEMAHARLQTVGVAASSLKTAGKPRSAYEMLKEFGAIKAPKPTSSEKDAITSVYNVFEQLAAIKIPDEVPGAAGDSMSLHEAIDSIDVPTVEPGAEAESPSFYEMLKKLDAIKVPQGNPGADQESLNLLLEKLDAIKVPKSIPGTKVKEATSLKALGRRERNYEAIALWPRNETSEIASAKNGSESLQAFDELLGDVSRKLEAAALVLTGESPESSLLTKFLDQLNLTGP